tara:strand:- start:4178 stop:5929 length:1752 start_codon:yes stop_codon:yes gene_type:complete
MSVIGEELRMLRQLIMEQLDYMFGTIYRLFIVIKNYIITNTKIFASGLLVFIWILTMFYIFSYDPYKIATVYPQASRSFSLFVLFLLIMTFTFVKFRKDLFKDVPDASKKSDYPTIFGYNLKLVLILLAGYFIVNSFSRVIISFLTNSLVKTSLIALINGVIIAGAIALTYKLVASQLLNSSKKTKTGLLLLFNFLFYIPCKITEVFDYIHKQINITPSVTWTILLIELLVIVFGFLLPKLLTHFLEKKGMILLKEPIYINQKILLASAEDLEPKTEKSYFSFNPKKEHEYNYAISAWVRVNPQPPTGIVKTGYEPCNQLYVSGAGNSNVNQTMKRKYKQLNGVYKLVSNANDGGFPVYKNRNGCTATKVRNEWIIKANFWDSNIKLTAKSFGANDMRPPRSGWKEQNYDLKSREKEARKNSKLVKSIPSAARVVCISSSNELDCDRTNTCETINTRIDGYLPVITYGGMPDIVYNPKKNKLEVRIEKANGEKRIVYQMSDVPLQKWNHIVMNFNSGTLDLFINNKLVVSKPNLLTLMKPRPLIAGSDNGFEGGIRNVAYFSHTLTKQEISLFYNNYKKTDML